MAKEIFSIAAVFWILIPIGLVGGGIIIKVSGRLILTNTSQIELLSTG